MKEAHPDFRNYVREKIAVNKFMHAIGFDITEINPGEVIGVLPFKEMHEQQDGFLHGGITSALCDIVTGFAAYSLVDRGQRVFTVESKVCYLRPGKGSKYTVRGWVVKPGRRFHFCEGELFYEENGERIVVARSTTTMAVV